MLSKPVTKWAAIVVLLAALVGTHWWSYRLGVQVEHARTANFVEGMYDAQQAVDLSERVQVLIIMAKHPQAFDMDDVKPYCNMTLAIAQSIEKSAIVPARNAGDDPTADRLQQQVDEARRLVARLTKGRS